MSTKPKQHNGWHIMDSRRLTRCKAHRPRHSCPWLPKKRCLEKECNIYFDRIHRFNKDGDYRNEPGTGFEPLRFELKPREVARIIEGLDALKEPNVIDLSLNGLTQYFRMRLEEDWDVH